MPSLTPLTNLNSGFRMYEVDSGVGARVLVRELEYSRTNPDVRHPGCIHVRADGCACKVTKYAHLVTTWQLGQPRQRIPRARQPDRGGSYVRA